MRRSVHAAALLLALLAYALPAVAQDAPEAGGDTSIFRPLDLRAPNQYRSATGAPGPAYWQQRADYRIAATLDTASKRLSGRATIRYHNNSPDPLRFVWLQVDQNLYKAGSLGAQLNPADTRWGARDFQGGYVFGSTTVDGKAVEPYLYDTMMRLDLPRPLAPGKTVDLQLAWYFEIPEHGSDRMGREGNLYEMAQWFPRMAVYDDVSGWNTDPYLGQGEFYREFGDYDVAITLPAGFVVGATGTLLNPHEVLTPAQRERLARAVKSDRQIAIITPQEAGTAAARPRTSGTLTWRFRAENVHDFAWGASPDFRWDALAWNGITCHALYGPDAPAWTTAAEMTCFGIQDFSRRWFPYPWPQATSVAGPVGGMEYPMFVMVHNTGEAEEVFGTIVHEHGHEWFPMIVSSNERRYAWMDEGFNTFIDTWPNDERYPGSRYSLGFARQNYEELASKDAELPIMTPPDRLGATLGVEAYRKPSLVLHLLREQVVGPEAFDAAFREYIRRWAYKHPTPADFFRTMQDVTGRDLSWFWREWLYTTDALDLAVTGVKREKGEDGANRATISLARKTPAVMPVRMRMTLANGETRDVSLPVEIWYNGAAYDYIAETPAPVTAVTLDPANALPDQDTTNNAWSAER